MTDFATAEPTLQRDRYGRPLIIPPGGGKPTPYTRCTTYVGAIDDTTALTKWKMRMVATGLAQRDDLLLAASAAADDKQKLNQLCEDAMEAAKASAAATTGTALHALTEQYDRGTLPPLTTIPKQYRQDLRAYIAATKPLNFTHIEQFMVNDELKIGGTPDRIATYNGQRWIVDLKTGSIEWAALKIAQQLAVYAHSDIYNTTDGSRTNIDVNRDRGIVIHLPAGTGNATLHWVDIKAGWEAVQVSRQVRQWRGRKGLTEPWPAEDDPDSMIRGEIIDAQTELDLRAVWARWSVDWTHEHTTLAKARLDQLGGGGPTAVHQH